MKPRKKQDDRALRHFSLAERRLQIKLRELIVSEYKDVPLYGEKPRLIHK